MLKPPSTRTRLIQSAVALLVALGLLAFRATLVWAAVNWIMDSFTDRPFHWLSGLGVSLLLTELKHIVRPSDT